MSDKGRKYDRSGVAGWILEAGNALKISVM
jgi:hypothetical protein